MTDFKGMITDKDVQEFAEHMRPLFQQYGLPTEDVLGFAQGFMSMMELQLGPVIERVLLEVHNGTIDSALEAFVGHSNFSVAYKRIRALKMTMEEFKNDAK